MKPLTTSQLTLLRALVQDLPAHLFGPRRLDAEELQRRNLATKVHQGPDAGKWTATPLGAQVAAELEENP